MVDWWTPSDRSKPNTPCRFERRVLSEALADVHSPNFKKLHHAEKPRPSTQGGLSPKQRLAITAPAFASMPSAGTRTPSSGTMSKSRRRKRFTPDECGAFGRRPFVAAAPRRGVSATELLKRQTASSVWPRSKEMTGHCSWHSFRSTKSLKHSSSAPCLEGLETFLIDRRGAACWDQYSSTWCGGALGMGAHDPASQMSQVSPTPPRSANVPLCMESLVHAEVARLLTVSDSPQKSSGSCPQSPSISRPSSQAEQRPFTSGTSLESLATSASCGRSTLNHLCRPGVPHRQAPTSVSRSKAGGCKAPTDAGDVDELMNHTRLRMLQRFRSVYDAFCRFDGEISRERGLLQDEFGTALGRLGFLAGEAHMLFAALDVDRSGAISLTEFLEALVNVSPDALLWELRCRLDSVGVQPSNLQKAFDLIQAPWPAQVGCGGSPGARGQPRLGHASWLQFCSKLGLTIKDSEQLFVLMDVDLSGCVDLREMFRVLRAVAPETSFEGLVGKLFSQYGSLREAFSSHAKDSVMGYEEFLELASTLDINDHNAAKLWQAFMTGDAVTDELGDHASLTEEAFVHLMITPNSSAQCLQQELRVPTRCGVATSGGSGAVCSRESRLRHKRSGRSSPSRRQRRNSVL